MKRFFVFAALATLVALGVFVVRYNSGDYSQATILNKSRRILEHGGTHRLDAWFLTDSRVSFDTLARICSYNISQFDTVRSAIFNSISEIDDTSVLQLMSVKVVSGNPIEKLIASRYIYRYYGVEMKLGRDMPLAYLLVLFHSTADALRGRQTVLLPDFEHKLEVARTFPKSRTLYREFILNGDLPFHIRKWFVESLAENPDRETITAFLQDLQKDIESEDPIDGAVKDVIYTLTHRGAQGDWIARPQ